MMSLEKLNILDKDRRKTGINNFTDFYAVYLNSVQNDYDFDDVHKFGEVIRRCQIIDS